jgi:hypothetical protein
MLMAMTKRTKSTAKKRKTAIIPSGVKISSGGGVKWNLKFDENFHPKNFLPFIEKNGKYYIDKKELPMDHPEEWQSIILAEMAKGLLKDE